MQNILQSLIDVMTPGNDYNQIISMLDDNASMLADGSSASTVQLGSYRFGNLYKSGTDMYTIVNTDLTSQ
jgi:hypothetical protein